MTVFTDSKLENEMIFKDRSEAGRLLSFSLEKYQAENCLVLGIPGGGVPIADEISRRLKLPLDVLVSKKIGAINHPEFAIGAISENDTLLIDWPMVKALGYTNLDIRRIISDTKREVSRRVFEYRGNRPLDLRDKTVILVDDGLATGVTAQAAVKAASSQLPSKIVLAVPVSAYTTALSLRSEVSDLICLSSPEDLVSISFFYHDFAPVSDEEIINILRKQHNFTSALSF